MITKSSLVCFVVFLALFGASAAPAFGRSESLREDAPPRLAGKLSREAFAGRPVSTANAPRIYSPNRIVTQGDTLYTVPLISPLCLGVTVVNDMLIVSSGGYSSALAGDNYFYRYTLSGSFVDSFPQHSTTGFGFRDLAFDGAHILASENSKVMKIDPVTFAIVDSVINYSNSLHRGLAYDSGGNTIWSSNSQAGPLVRFDAATGATAKNYGVPPIAHYGIALDTYTDSGRMAIWLAEPWTYGSFKISRVDTSLGLIDHTVDLSSFLGDSSLCGGMEIINNHPSYPGKVIAVVVEQTRDRVVFADITGSPAEYDYYLSVNQHFGGLVSASAVKGSYAYLCEGGELTVVDISGQEYRKVAFLDCPGEATRISLNGDYAYVICGSEFLVVNITDPLHPLMTSMTATGTGSLVSLSIDGTHAYLGFRGNWGESGFLVVDVSTPASPLIVGTSAPGVPADGISASGNYLYAAGYDNSGNRQLAVFDVSVPSSPAQSGSINLNGAGSVFLRGHYAFVGGGETGPGLFIVNVANPGALTLSGTFGSSGPGALKVHSIFVRGDTCYFVADVGLKGNLVITDVSDTSNIVKLGEIADIGDYLSTLQVDSTLAFVSGGDVFKAIDVSTPSASVISRSFDMPSAVQSIGISGDALYLGDSAGKLRRFDTTIPAVPAQESSIPLSGGARRILANGNYVYAIDGQNGQLHILDYSNPGNPVELSSYTAGGRIAEFAASGRYVYLCTKTVNKLEIVDVFNPSGPSKIGEMSLRGEAKDVLAPESGSNIFIAYFNNDSDFGIQVIDVSNPSAPALVRTMPTPYWPVAVSVQRNTAFIAMIDGTGASWFLYAYDISDPANPVHVAGKSAPGSIWDIELKDGGMIIASLPDSGMIQTLFYDFDRRSFQTGPSIQIPMPGQIALSEHFALNRGAFSASPFADEVVVRDSTDYQLFVNSGSGDYGAGKNVIGENGLYGIEIRKVSRRPSATKTVLTMSISPAAAASEGCRTAPLPGTHLYNVSEVAGLSAAANGFEGWNFKNWSGSASGTNPSTNVIMDQDRTATANFVKPALTISGDVPARKVLLPSETGNPVDILTVQLAASDADDWNVRSVTFHSSGSGHEADDLQYVSLQRPGGSITGHYSADDSTVTFEFGTQAVPALIVPRSGNVNLTLQYRFNFIDRGVQCPTGLIRDFNVRVSESDVSAVPVNYAKYAGFASQTITSNAVAVACVKNAASGRGFAAIQTALDDPQNSAGDSITVSPGVYHEALIIGKSVVLRSNEGRDSTTIASGSKTSDVVAVRARNVTVSGFTLSGGLCGIRFRGTESDSVLITGNLVEKNMWGIVGTGAARVGIRNGNIITGNTWNGVSLDSCAHVVIDHSSAGGNLAHGIKITNSSDVHLEQLDVSGNTGDGVRLERVADLKILDCFVKFNLMNGVYADYLDRVVYDRNIISGNHITGNQECGIIIGNSRNSRLEANIIKGNAGAFERNGASGAVSFVTSGNNEIESNDISGNRSRGMYFNNADNNLVRRNRISANRMGGICLADSRMNRFVDNEVFNHGLPDESPPAGDGILVVKSAENLFSGNNILRNGGGIRLDASDRNELAGNTIEHNMRMFPAGPGTGIRLESSNSNIVRNNQVNSNGDGISLSGSGGCSIRNNHIWYNVDAGIRLENSEASVSGNSVWFNHSPAASAVPRDNEQQEGLVSDGTGIHVTGSTAWISGNNIARDRSDGIAFENGSTGTVRWNNILANDGAGVKNLDQNVTIDARHNWWGDATGPGGDGPGTGDEAAGNIDYSVWSTSPIGVIISAERDTALVRPAGVDTVALGFQNWQNPGDTLTVSLSDSLGWLSGPGNFSVSLGDSSGAVAAAVFSVPPGTPYGTVNKVIVRAVSQSDTTQTDLNSFAMLSYAPDVARIEISPDSAVIGAGHRKQFSVRAFDKHGFAAEFKPAWSATGGTIDSAGFYSAGNDTGIFAVTAKDTVTQIQTVAGVRIVADVPLLARIDVRPDSSAVFRGQKRQFAAVGIDQFDSLFTFSPVWSATGGVIDSTGLYTAGDSLGNFAVVARDTAAKIEALMAVFVVPRDVTLLYPANGTSDVALTPMLAWSPYPDFLTYEVQVSKDSLFTRVAVDDSTVARNQFKFGPLQPDTTYYWRVTARTLSDSIALSPVWHFTTTATGVDGPGVSVRENMPREFRLGQNYPNPFGRYTVINYQLPSKSRVALRVFNVRGQEVKAIVDAVEDAGYKSVRWDGTDGSGRSVSSGVYIVRLTASQVSGGKRFVSVKKLVLLK